MAEKNKGVRNKGASESFKGRMLDFVPTIVPKGKGKA